MNDAQVRWQPRLTPYRFLVLLTTIGLGSAKAYAVSRNLTLVATSIEWVSGVVVFSILFALGLCEPEPPHLLKWLLVPDLVPILCKLLSLNPPRYRSDEGQDKPEVYVTGYRLLTSITVACFGIAKAYFTYQGRTGAANVFDWSFGIIVTSLLYILGLYENNTANLMPSLFIVSYSGVVRHASWILTLMVGIYLLLLTTYTVGVGYDHEQEGLVISFVLYTLAPISIVIILSFLLLESSLSYASNFFQTGNRVFADSALRLRRLSQLTRRIRERGIMILFFLNLSTLAFGVSLYEFFCIRTFLRDGHSDKMLWNLSIYIIKLLCALPMLVMPLCHFPMSILFLGLCIRCLLDDNFL